MKLAVRLVLCLAVLSCVAIPAAATTEFRGLYVDAFHPGIKTHEQVTQMVSAAKAANFNALIVQVRKRGDAYYNSGIEPKASDIAPDYDPLADVIQQAHAVGIGIHAWLSVYEVSHESYTVGPRHVCKLHPEWLMTGRDGRTALGYGKVYTDPGLPAVQDHFLSIVKDIIQNYQVDGIHLDNVRYSGLDAGYNKISVQRFNQDYLKAGRPQIDDADWCEWRRGQVTDLVRKTHDLILQTKPRVELSASVMLADPSVASSSFLQEWAKWTSEELVDFLVPMVFTKAASISGAAASAMRSTFSRHIYIGIGAWQLSQETAGRHVAEARASGSHGVVLYSYHYLGPNCASAECIKLSHLKSSTFGQPAGTPELAWKR